MRMIKLLDDRFVEVPVCDTCFKVCENGDYMGDEGNMMCINCFNKFYAKRFEPKKKPAAGTTD